MPEVQPWATQTPEERFRNAIAERTVDPLGSNANPSAPSGYIAPTHAGRVLDVFFPQRSDGSTLVTVGMDSAIHVWNLESFSRLVRSRCYEGIEVYFQHYQDPLFWFELPRRHHHVPFADPADLLPPHHPGHVDRTQSSHRTERRQ